VSRAVPVDEIGDENVSHEIRPIKRCRKCVTKVRSKPSHKIKVRCWNVGALADMESSSRCFRGPPSYVHLGLGALAPRCKAGLATIYVRTDI